MFSCSRVEDWCAKYRSPVRLTYSLTRPPQRCSPRHRGHLCLTTGRDSGSSLSGAKSIQARNALDRAGGKHAPLRGMDTVPPCTSWSVSGFAKMRGSGSPSSRPGRRPIDRTGVTSFQKTLKASNTCPAMWRGWTDKRPYAGTPAHARSPTSVAPVRSAHSRTRHQSSRPHPKHSGGPVLETHLRRRSLVRVTTNH